MSVDTRYVVACDGVIGTHGRTFCPYKRQTPAYPTLKEAEQSAKVLGFKQPYPSSDPAHRVCGVCWEEYKRWGHESE